MVGGAAMLLGGPRLVVFGVLGPLRVDGPDREIRIGGMRRRGVLLRLLASPGRPVPVDSLAEDVWQGVPPAAAASTLQSHVSALRQAVGSDRLVFADGGYQLAVGPGELDSLAFEADVTAGRTAISAGDFGAAAAALDRGLSRWRGQAFADVSGAAWSVLPAGHLEQVRNTAVEEALEAYLALGRHHEVCGMAEEAVAAEPLRERRWAALMLALYRAGRQADALDAYRRLRDMLAGQLGLDPSPRLSRLQHGILEQSPDLDWTGPPPGAVAQMRQALRRTPGVRDNLPSSVASFVGRQTELAELDKLIGQHRLVTIVGAGGAGKTRLAIETAASRLDDYRDGVWFVDLAELSDPGEVAAAVAEAIGLQRIPDQPVEQVLMDSVAGLQALLVVDNCEHLVGMVAETVEKVLVAGPEMRVIATSRQPLRVPGERVWQTPPISFPNAPDRHDGVGLASFDAVKLFLDRAPELTGVSSAELRMIAEITARLDGLPLAIELAAARAGQLDLPELASALQDRISLSWLGSRTTRARQRTLAATIGWSYDLLTPAQQSALKRLAVFCGGFTLEAAAAVTGSAEDVTGTVASLAERSLIEADRNTRRGRPGPVPVRYRMLETIRQYCATRSIGDDGPSANSAAMDAHSDYFARLAQQASATLTGWHQGQWMTRLDADHANLTAAISHLLAAPGQAGTALRMVIHLDRFWRTGGYQAECLTLLRRGLTAAGAGIGSALRCEALNVTWSAAIQNDIEAARSYATELLRIARAASDDFHAARALAALAFVGNFAGETEEGCAAGKAAVELARSVGDPVLLGECLVALGEVTSDRPGARVIFEEALAVTHRSGDRLTGALARCDLGYWLLTEDDLEAARGHLEHAREILREIGAPSGAPTTNLGWVRLRGGSPDAADAAFAEALRAAERRQKRMFGSYPVLGLACSAATRGEWVRAARLLGFADGQLQDCGAVWVEPERTYRELLLSDAQSQLGIDFERRYDSGRAGDRGDLIDLALGQQRMPDLAAPSPELI
jgi:predicted ATPase/DNA-binding SARP family transcriptional activator